ncbi:MAG: hypothetical protein HDR01_00880 [Lachnospiraceae bacterium]|nr:hypothetical protein [Lachnospiraceae bacterium]
MKKKERKNRLLLKYILTFLCTGAICMVFLFLASCLPQKYIQDGSEKSAEYFMEQELFPCLKKGMQNTKYDNYADCLLFHIAYQMDAKKPFPSMIKAVYYDYPQGQVNEDFHAAVFEGKKANTTYFRYWHGAVCLLRPLLCIWSVWGIRKALGVCLLLLNVALGILLWKKGQKGLFCIYFLSLLCVKIWIVAFSIEYIMAFILMTAMIICFIFCEKAENWKIFQLSIISGVLTCFFDFLTVETVTITVPLLFLAVMKQNEGRLASWKKEIGFATASCFFWGLSYGGMFFGKWLLAAAMMGKRVLGEVADTAGYRIAHGEGDGIFLRLYHAAAYNISCLFGDGEISVWIISACLAAMAVLIWKGGTFQRLLLCLGMVPYLRFLILSGHSMEHYFFTYRAQIITIMAVGMVVWYKGKAVLKERKST